MAMLGDILAAARRSSGDFEQWLATRSPALTKEVEEASRRTGESSTDYVRGALSAFSELASEEDWANLTSRMRDSSDPGTVCLLAMVQWRLAVEKPAKGAKHDPGT